MEGEFSSIPSAMSSGECLSLREVWGVAPSAYALASADVAGRNFNTITRIFKMLARPSDISR